MSAVTIPTPTGADTFRPSLVTQVELTGPIPAIAPSNGDYSRAQVLARLHGHPIATIEVELTNGELSQEDLASAFWSQARDEINSHLRTDGLEPVESLTASGLPSDQSPICWQNAATDDAPLVTIVIATKDRPQVLEGCLDTLLELDYPKFEIIVVENGSNSDASEQMIKRRFSNAPQIRYIRESAPGASRARNTGVREANGEIIAVTDDDVIVDRLWLKALTRQLITNKSIDCVTGLVLPAQLDTPSQAWFEEYGGFNKGYSAKVFTKERHTGASLLYPYTAGVFGSGNNAAYRRQALLDRGAYDLNLGPGTPALGGEDLDTFLAIILDGGAIAYEPAAIIQHFHRSEYPELHKQIRDYGIGLSAMITKRLLTHPRTFVDIATRIPLGVWTVVSPSSKKNAKKSPDYPSELTKAELQGLAIGPLRYLESVRKNRK